MAIEKMSLLLVEGHVDYVDEALLRCCESGLFHITPSVGGILTRDRTASYSALSGTGSYRPLLGRAAAAADLLGIKRAHADYSQLEMSQPREFDEFLTEVEGRLFGLRERRDELSSLYEQHKRVLGNIEQLIKMNSNLDELFSLEYNRVRFGRLPLDGYQKLTFFENRNFVFFPYQKEGDYVWGMYMTSLFDSPDIDEIFASIYFERIRLPDYIHGTPVEAREQLEELIKTEAAELDEIESDIGALKGKVGTKLLRALAKLQVINESDELRGNVAVSGQTFFLCGFVPSGEKKKFIEYLETDTQSIRGSARRDNENENKEAAEKAREYNITVGEMPVGSGAVRPPVRLKNNFLFRPFEMFVSMYGLPAYDSIDCTPFVAITYTLIYGIMFGDLGQGLFLCALGFLLAHWKKLKLGSIMVRIGLSGAFFGTMYGSVFGNEELIKPFFRAPAFYNLIGANAPPESLFNISTFLLLASLGIGVFLIIFVMLLNIVIGFKQGDAVNALLSPSGVNGFLLYTSVVAGVGLKFIGVNIMSAPYVLFLIILPLCVLFFREPIMVWAERARNKAHEKRMLRDTELLSSIDKSSNSISKAVGTAVSGEYSYQDFINSPFIDIRYGSFLYKNYEILKNYKGRSQFFFFPLERDGVNVSGVYVAAKELIVEVDSLFESLGFKFAPLPISPDGFSGGANIFHVDTAVSEAVHEKKSVGIFIIESSIEVFENLLTYLTNTMSFLRVGGFVLSHAGMMMVVRVLAQGAGKGAIIVEILGNLFVIGMEGFLVGIQVLRLEFYEMFGRFYKSGGKPFAPVNVDKFD